MCKLSPFQFEIFLSLSEYQQTLLLTSHLLLASVVVVVYSPFNYCRCSVVCGNVFAATVAKQGILPFQQFMKSSVSFTHFPEQLSCERPASVNKVSILTELCVC